MTVILLHKIVTSDKWKQGESPLCSSAGCVQLEYLLDQGNLQPDWVEKDRRRLEGELTSVPKSLSKMEKNKSGLEELVKRSDTQSPQQ